MFRKIKGPFSKIKKPAKKQPEILRYEELEQRLLFSADVVPGLDSIAVDEQVLVENVASDVQAEREAAPQTVEQTAAQARSELVLVNENVADYEQLIADLQGSDTNRIIEVVVLESDRDGIEQVSEILAERNDLDAIHIISHGSDGAFSLGGDWLNNADLLANSETIAAWGNALSEDADILLYGCNVAADVDGQNLTDTLAVLTGADVAASDDKTGHEDLGADWDLEYQTDAVEASTVLDGGVPWEHTLGVVANQAPWTNLAVTTDRSTTISETYTVTATPGSDRLLLATMVTRFGFDQTIDVTSASFGGVQMHEIVEGSSDTTRNGVWMGYLLDSEIPAGEQTLTVSFTSTVSDPTGTKLLAATYVGVDQTTPINDSSANNTKVNAPISFGSQIDYVAGAEVVYVASFGGNTNTNTTEPAGYSKIYTNEWSGLLMTTIGHKDDAATAGYSPDSTAVDFEGTDANHSLAVVALNPVLNQAPTGADNTVTTDEDIPYTFSASDFNFSDTDDDTLDSVKITSLEAVGSLRLSGVDVALNQVISKADIDTGNLKFVPVAGANGPGYDSFGFSVNDGTIDSATSYTMTIDVTAVNDAPTFIDGSVGNWNFDEGSGDSVAESAIGISTGTLGSASGADANDPTWTTGKFGQALHFDGANDYIEIADAPGIDISGPQFSASLWMNPDSGPNKEDMLFMKGDRQGNINYYLSWKDSGEMTWAFKDSAGWHYQDMPVTMPTTGQWNHIGITFDRPTVSLYVNGTKYVFDNVATGGSMDRDLTANDEVLWIGAGRDAGALVGVNQWSGPFTGSIDELALFDRALTDAEIEAIRTSTPPAVTASAFSIDENSANNTVVGTVVANDQDIGDTLSYAITAGNTGGAFSIDANGQIKVANSTALDFETNPTFTLTVEADDGNGGTDVQTISVSVTDANEVPVDLQVTATSEGGAKLNTDGGNDLYLVADDGGTLLGGLTTVTVESSFSITTPAGDVTPLLSYATGANDEELGLFIKNDGSIWFMVHSPGAPYQSTANQYSQLFDGEKHHVGVSWNASNGAVVFYVDGQEVESFTGYLTGETIIGGGELVFGQDQDSVLGGFVTTDVFSGTLYDVRIFNDVRTDVEIANGYDQTLPGTEPGMIANWVFDNLTTAGVVTDTVSGNNLTEQHVSGTGFSLSTPELSLSVPENAANDTVIGSLSAIDPDNGETFGYSLEDDAGGRFAINNTTGELTVADGSLLNYQSNTSHDITVRVTDSMSNTYDEVFTIQVMDVNDAPAGANNTVSTAEDTDYVFDAADFGFTDPNNSPADNFANVIITTTVANGTLYVDANGNGIVDGGEALNDLDTVGVADISAGRLKFKPAANQNGTGYDSFTFQVQDDGGTAYSGVDTDPTASTMTIDVSAADDPAVISGDISYSGNEGDAVAGDLNATDVEGLTDATYFTISAQGSNGTAAIDAETGAWTFTPSEPNWFGTDSFTVTVTDDLSGTTSQVVNITLVNVDDGAVITGDVSYTGNEGDAVAGDLNATDVDGLTDGTYFSVTTPATNGTAAIDTETGAWTFTPTDPNWFGSDSFMVTVTDDLGGTTTQVVSITLANVNDAPVMTAWFNDTWDTRKGLTINAASVAGDVTNFPVLITLTTDTELATQALANGDDILFTAADGVTQLAHEIEFFDETTGELRVWVKTDLSGSVDTNIYMYFGNAASGPQENIPGVWDNYVGVYHLSESPTGAPGELADSSGSGNNATTEGAMDAADSVSTTIGQGLAFDGSNDMIRIPDSATLDSINDEATFSLWINFVDAADGDTQIIMSSDNRYSGWDGYEWANQGDGDHFFYPDAMMPDVNYNLGANPFTNGDWHHLAATMDFANQEVKIYVDGTPMTFTYEGVPGNWTSLTSSDDLLFGGNPDRATRFFNGMMDEIRIADVARSQEWIQTEVNNQSAPGSFFSLDVAEDCQNTLTDINEDDFTSAGDTVLSIINSSGADRITDDDAIAVEGIAVTGVDDTNGEWQYDANADGTWLSFGSVTDSNAVLLDTGALVRFVPDADYNGTAGDLTFHAWDQTSGANGNTGIDVSTNGGDTAFSTETFNATLNVIPVDDAAVITGDISYVGNEGDVIAGDLNATDVDGLTDTTYFTVSSAATNGTAAIDAESGAWNFTPTDPNWFGSDSFTVTVTDDLGGTTAQVVNITLANVDDAAVITGDVSYSGNEGDAVAGDLNATDVEGLTDTTYFTISAQGSNGTAAIDAETGAWTFTPTDLNWFGSDSFTVTVTDDLGGTTTQVVNITLANVDDAAVISGDISFTGNEGDAVSGTMGATDVDGLTDSTYFTVSSAATNGTAAINAETGAWTFTPTDPNWFGSDIFTVTVTDDLGGTTTQVVNITLANVDDAAVISGDISYTGNEGDAVSGTMGATDVDGLTDSTYFTVSSAATNGTAAINAETGAWTFTPTDPNWFGSDSFTVTVTDDLGGTTTQVVNITLANVDDGAVITGDVNFSGNEGDAVAGDLNATDVEGLTDTTYFTVTTLATNGTAAIDATTGAWTFTPSDPNWFGSDAFTVTVTDDLGGTTTQVVNITLANVDDTAVISGDISYTGNEGDAVAGDLNATDVDGLTDTTYFTVSAQGSNGTAAIDAETGAWTFTPTDPNWFGSDAFTVTVTDDLGGTTTQVVSIILANVDDASIITGDVSYSGNEGDAVAGDLNATDVEGLTDSTYFTVTTPATNGTAAIDATTGAWTFTPTDPNWFGSDAFTVTVTDDLGGTTTQVVSITLANVDDASVITGDVSYSGNEGDAVAGDLNATDVEGLTDTTYFSVTTPATNGTAAINAETGAWTFTPTDPNWFGSDAFTVTVTDDLGGTTTQVVNITLANVDDGAVITGDVSFSGNEGDAVAGDLNATDVDGLTDTTYFSVTTPATNGTAAIDATTGAWTFTPTDPNWFGSDNFTVTVTDDLGGTTTQVVSITLSNVDDAAVITGAVSYSGNEGDAVAGDMDATDVEGLTDGTYFTVTTPASNGTAAIDAGTGAWTFTPTDPNWFGSDSFTVTVTDDLGGTTSQVVSITLSNDNDPAVITGDVSYSGNEGDAVTGDLNATDVDGLTDGTYFSVTTPATNGMAAIDATTGAWTFTPSDPNWYGSDSFTVTVTDDLGGATTQVVSITLANVDDPAVISGDISFTGNEGDAVSGTMGATDVDGLTDSTYFTVSSAATNGTAAIDPASGAWTFTPTDPNWFGSDSFTVTVTDDLGGTTTQVVNITLANVDDAAVITGDVSYSGNEGDAVAGDMDATDVEGLTDGTYFTVTTPATNGTAAIDAATGAWTFTPTDANWFGSDAFTVTVTDDLGGTTTQVVNITLANVDDASVITGDVSYSGNEGDAVAGDMDATDVDGLTDTTYFSVTTPATNGTAAIDATTGAWTFTPSDPNWFGSDSFTVTVTDDLGGTTTQVVSITLANVDDSAVISGDISFTGNEGDAVAGDLNATDVDGLTDTTYFTVSAQGSNGTAAIDPASGAWTFTPTDPNWFSSDAFTVTVTDDLGGMTTQVVNITLANVDDSAVITGDVSYAGNEGDAVSGTMGATDVDGLTDSTYFTVSSAATNGMAAIDPASGAWTFTPTDPNWFGSDAFTVTVTDDLGGTTTQVVNITLANVDDSAVITGDISFTGNEGDAVAGDLNATDVDGLTDTTYFTVSAQGSNGTAAIDAETGAWTFTPTAPNWFGSDTFTVTVTDDLGGTTTQVVSITLANANDPAVISGDVSYSGNEGDAVSGDMDATDVDGLTDTTYFTVSSPGSNGAAAIDAETGAWTFTPTDPNWFGSDTFTVTVTDDLGGTTTQVVSITLANVDDTAVITGDVSYSGNEGDAVAGDLNATDVEGLTDTTYFTVSSAATNGSAVIDAETGAWSFTPTDPNWFGTDSFEVTVTDDFGGTTTQLISITLANVDDAAVINGDISFSGNEGDAVSGDLNATDVEGLTDTTYFTVSSAATNGSAVIDAETGAWTFTPSDPNWFGSDSFTVTVTDDLGGTTTQVVNVTLANIDDGAVITGDVSYSGNEGDAVAGDLNATDVDGLTDTTYFTVSAQGSNGTAGIDATTGAWTFTPSDPNWFGSDSFTVTVTDDLGGTTTQVVNITLANVDDASVITGDVSYSGNEGDVVAGDLNATDVEGLTDTTYFSVTTPATNGTAAIDATTGAWTFTPTDPNWFGSDAFTVTVTDDLGGTTTQVVNITLANVDDTAVITGDVSYSGNEGDAVAGDLNATDVEGLTDTTYFTVSAQGSNGTAAIDATTGAWTFTPTDPNWFGSDAFTVTVTDDLGGTTTQVVSITLANVDDSSVITGDVSYSGNEGDALAGDLNATDVEGLTDTTYFSVTTPATNGTAAIDATTGAWTFTPTDPNWFGSDSFTVTVTDDLGGTTTQVVSITLANVNDAPSAAVDSISGNEDTVVVDNILSNDNDVDGDALTTSAVSGPSNGSLTLNADGSFSYTPNANWNGTDSFTYTANDGALDSNVAAVTITVNPVNDVPTVTSSAVTAATEDAAYSYTITTGDVEGDAMTITAPVLPAWLTLVDNGDGTATLSGTPTNAEVGDHSVVLQVSDSSSTDTQNFTLNVSEATIVPPIVGTDPGPIFEDPEPDDADDSDVDDSTNEEPAEDPLAEDVPVPLDEGNRIPEDSSDADDSIVLTKDPDAQETEEIIYLSDEVDTDIQSEEREDDHSYVYFDNNFYKEIISAKHLNFNSNTPENTLELSELADSGVVDFASDDWKQVVAKEDYILLREEIDETFSSEQQSNAVKANIVTASMTTFTVGIASYFLRAGSMVSSLMSSLPLWRGFDPIAIFVGKKKRKKDRNELPNTDKSKSETLFDGEAE